MAVLPATPQTATQANPHPLNTPHAIGQTQLIAPAANHTANQPQLLYQPYNFMQPQPPSSAFQHHYTSDQQTGFRPASDHNAANLAL